MKYIKYVLAYICLLISDVILILLILDLIDYIHMSNGDRFFLIFIINSFCMYLYHKYKPFKLTGNLDIYLKEKWDNYLDSQKTCLNCSKVVKSSEIKNGICKSCRDLDNKNLNSGYERKKKDVEKENEQIKEEDINKAKDNR
ncbi:hypothetical protein [Aliarcobacter butzleri]|uniref:Uncharacterized protein n=1 Tax=Aliarcobacter butzleri TaxID=28197 RepID=A0AAW7PQH5_9BACT|nr:hypothetical protein [Aliarcobacter butzleri]MCG3673868.1 hypothetical protein [Aliarcobacter butzleri]MCG3696431.1 hypothetical protein [Aliarcobacter butzleri]MCG3698615.1 hypothetical protein [Aliarcobacter butzleri]MCT7619046.1 hypothetical protein [Aliarcobacter butzleri]MDN5063283.1 hypothetical protein [Aliarcobacter butzleri]